MAKPKMILVVDDERSVRAGWARAMKLAGYTAHQAATATDALSLCDEHLFDLVIVDFLMPQMDGVELLRQIRQRQPLTRSILVSGKIDTAASEEDISRDARQAVEADVYLHKPLSNERLKAAVMLLLDKPDLQEWKDIAGAAVRERKRRPQQARALSKRLKKLTKRSK